jgi:hypothetical protein
VSVGHEGDTLGPARDIAKLSQRLVVMFTENLGNAHQWD